jgi:hypothetical protein
MPIPAQRFAWLGRAGSPVARRGSGGRGDGPRVSASCRPLVYTFARPASIPSLRGPGTKAPSPGLPTAPFRSSAASSRARPAATTPGRIAAAVTVPRLPRTKAEAQLGAGSMLLRRANRSRDLVGTAGTGTERDCDGLPVTGSAVPSAHVPPIAARSTSRCPSRGDPSGVLEGDGELPGDSGALGRPQGDGRDGGGPSARRSLLGRRGPLDQGADPKLGGVPVGSTMTQLCRAKAPSATTTSGRIGRGQLKWAPRKARIADRSLLRSRLSGPPRVVRRRRRPLSRAAGNAELLHERREVTIEPLFDDLSVDDPVDVRTGHCRFLFPSVGVSET